jgi:hypothetical protein
MKNIELAKFLAWSTCLDKGMTFNQTREFVKNFYSGSRAILDDEMKTWVKSLPNISDCLYNHTLISAFENKFADWLNNNKHNRITGLNNFQPDISQGATQVFDSFLVCYGNKRIRFLPGEYFYHVVVCEGVNRPYKYINEVSDIIEGDAVIVSVPFCDTGSKPEKLSELLDHCDMHNIPVLLDCAYWTLSKGMEINVDRPCIKMIAFSFSKTWPVSHARVGIRFTRPNFIDGQKLHSKINYDNRLSAAIGLKIMQSFNSDYVVDKYWDKYQLLCQRLGLTPGNSVLFADGDNTWQQYSRKSLLDLYGVDQQDSLYKKRICLTQLLENWPLVVQLLKSS